MFFFFFQAEDGIRDLTVTGVQTCALPISARSVARHNGRSRGRMSRTPRTALIGSERGMVFDGSRSSRNDRGDQGAARLVSLARMPSNPIALVQLASLILAALALIMGAYLLII